MRSCVQPRPCRSLSNLDPKEEMLLIGIFPLAMLLLVSYARRNKGRCKEIFGPIIKLFESSGNGRRTYGHIRQLNGGKDEQEKLRCTHRMAGDRGLHEQKRADLLALCEDAEDAGISARGTGDRALRQQKRSGFVALFRQSRRKDRIMKVLREIFSRKLRIWA